MKAINNYKESELKLGENINKMKEELDSLKEMNA